jgi:hypothetical protein
VLNYREDHQRVEKHGVGDLLQNAVKQALERTKV